MRTEPDQHQPTAIRPGTIADYEALCDLFAELDRVHRDARPDQFRQPEGPARSEGLIRGLIAGPDSTILVAQRREGVVGLALLLIRQIPASLVRPSRRIAEIDNLVVAGHARGQGIGRALIRAGEVWAAGRRAQTMELGVHEFNAGAIGFYQRVGLETAMRRMEKTLSAI